MDAYDFYQRKANAHILTQVDVHAFFRLFISRILAIPTDALDILDTVC